MFAARRLLPLFELPGRASPTATSVGQQRPADIRIQLLVGTLLALGLILLVHPVARLNTRVSLNYNEGWNAYHARAAMSGSALYPAADSLVTNNYPPLSFFLVGLAGAGGIDLVIAGRLLALASILIVALLVGMIVQTVTASGQSGVFAAATFLVYCLVHFDMYVAMNDPTWLAHATSLLALACLVRGEGVGSAAAAGLLSATSLFIKHSVLPLPLALAVWAFCVRGRRAVAWLITFTAGVGLMFGLCHWLWGAGFWRGVFGSPRDLSVWYLAPKLNDFYTPMAPLAAGALLSMDRGTASRPTLLWTYLAVAVVWSAVMLAGDGVNYNAVFDPLVALAMLVGIATGAPERSATARLGVMLVSLLSVAPALPMSLLQSYAGLGNLQAASATSARQIERLATAPSPVACETLALCYWAGKPMAVDFFNTAQKVKAGRMPIEPLGCLFETGAFSLLELASPSPAYGRFPPEVNRAIAHGYTPAETFPYRVLYAPSTSPPSSQCLRSRVLR